MLDESSAERPFFSAQRTAGVDVERTLQITRRTPSTRINASVVGSGERRGAVDRHQKIGFGGQAAQHMDSAVRALERRTLVV